MSRSESRTLKCLHCPAEIVLAFNRFTTWSDNPRRYLDAIGGKEGGFGEQGWVCGMHKETRT